MSLRGMSLRDMLSLEADTYAERSHRVEAFFMHAAAQALGRQPWNWASRLPGLPYRPGDTMICIPLYDLSDWRGRICCVTSTRRQP